MRHRIERGLVTMLAVLAPITPGAWAAAAVAPPEPPIAYSKPCPADPADPVRVSIIDTARGPIVEVQQRGAQPLETREANLAHKSRRFFFQLRTADALVEFQGHATAAALDGLLSDAHGARRIIMPAETTAPPAQRCGGQHS